MAIYYPDAHPETVCVDGAIAYTGAADWATARGAAVGTAVSDSIAANYVQAYKNASGQFGIQRLGLLFDTRTLPTTARILTAILSVNILGVENADNDGEDYLVVVTFNPASNTSLATGDFNKFSFTANSNTVDMTGKSGWVDFTLNATGIENIAKGDITKFGLIEGHDHLNHAYAGANDTGNSIQIATAESANKPKLTITYTVPGGNILWF